MSDVADLDLFIGSKSSYEKIKREKNIVEENNEPEESHEQKQKPTGNVAVLSKETLKDIDDEMVTILKRTRTVHDYSTVYMQSSIEFYDEYYNNTEMSDELKAARSIRRVYKVYADYLKAVEVRNNYIDSLIDKYGGENEFQRKMSLGMIKDWIPKMPVLSKRCPEYEMYLTGMVPLKSEILPDGTLEHFIETMNEDMKDIDVEQISSIETNIGLINQYNDYIDSIYSDYGISNKHSNTVTISDLDNLNKIFASWYKPETGKTETELFKNAPENIRKRFDEECAFNEPGLLTKIRNGEEIEEPEIDMNEMVHDSATGRNMTRGELMKRQTIRLLAECGWSESRLLNYANVGSKLERMSRKKKANKKRRRASTEVMDDFMNSPTGVDPIYSENDYLSNAFMDLMRGEN